MNEIEFLAKNIGEQLEAGRPLVLVSIMSLEGSTPRHSGTKMAVGSDGKSYGTIGGSLIEAAAIREARKVLTAKKSRIMAFELDGQGVTAPGMICGGKAKILLDYLAATAENLEFSRRWRQAMQKGKDFYILTYLKGESNAVGVVGHAVLASDGSIMGGGPLTGAEIEKLKPELHNISNTAVLPLGEARVMVDRIRRLKTLYCFGAGHVAVPTCHLAALVGFRVVVLDDRPEYTNMARFPEAYQTVVVKDFNQALSGLEIDADSFIVIVTRGHQYDRSVLEQALKTDAGYIGMISSRCKRDAIYEYLTDKRVTKDRLDQVHSPIGIDIGGETPEDIAVSIVAELISVRSRQATYT
jgi:xanthine dehydrogenase accessory factor